MDADDFQPLPEASVRFKSCAFDTITGLGGNFKLALLADVETVTFSYIRYSIQDVNIRLSSNF